jgi:hypothetical protein
MAHSADILSYMSRPIPFPEEVLTEIGRITVAASHLEFILAQFASEVLNDVSASELLSRPGRVLPAAQQAAASLEEGLADAFGTWVESARQLLSERHRIVHSTWLIRATAPGVGEYFGRHPRTHTDVDPDLGYLRRISSRLDECATDGFDLIFAHAPMLKSQDGSS